MKSRNPFKDVYVNCLAYLRGFPFRFLQKRFLDTTFELGKKLTQDLESMGLGEIESRIEELNEQFESAKKIYPNYFYLYVAWGYHLGDLAQCLPTEKSIPFLKEALWLYQRAARLNPDYDGNHIKWARLVLILGERTEGDEARRYFEESVSIANARKERDEYDWMMYCNWGSALMELFPYVEPDRKVSSIQDSRDKFEKGIELSPDNEVILRKWGIAFQRFAEYSEEKERHGLIETAIEKLQQAAALDPGDEYILLCMAHALAFRSNTEEGDDAAKSLNESNVFLQRAIELNPSNDYALGLYGNNLNRLGIHNNAAKLEKAIDLLDKAIAINPSEPEHYNNCAYACMLLGDMTETDEGLLYFEKSAELSRKAIDIETDNAWFQHQLADCFIFWGERLGSCEGLTHLEEAIDVIRKIENTCPDAGALHHSWGYALMRLGVYSGAEEKRKYFEDARSHYFKSIDYGTDSAVLYNLACLNSLEGRFEECLKWLMRAHEEGTLESKNRIENDDDLDPVRHEARFKEFVATLPDVVK
jgi:tetratricopeptide (TPR) repeat protein